MKKSEIRLKSENSDPCETSTIEKKETRHFNSEMEVHT